MIAALSSYLLLPLGWLLFGIASFRAGVYPRILCVAIMIGGLISYGPGCRPTAFPSHSRWPRSGCGVWSTLNAAPSKRPSGLR